MSRALAVGAARCLIAIAMKTDRVPHLGGARTLRHGLGSQRPRTPPGATIEPGGSLRPPSRLPGRLLAPVTTPPRWWRAPRPQIAPIVGTSTVEAVTPLTQRFAVRARERGIGLVGSTDPATTHVLKGYFSAIPEAQDTTVIYVWDVLDPSGNRLHRIQGQMKDEGTAAGNGGAAVATAPCRRSPTTTVDQLSDMARRPRGMTLRNIGYLLNA